MIRPASVRRQRAAPPISRLFATVSIAIAAVLGPGNAAAQIAVGMALKSDERFRGRSLSDGRPVVTLDVSFDSKDGAYLGGSATANLTGEERAGLQGVRAYAGYATQTASGIGLDAGIVAYRFTRRYSGDRADRYVEAYAGISRGALSGYLRFSPHYLGQRAPVIYAEIGAGREVAPKWRLNGHLGILVQTSGPPGLGGRRSRYDTRIGISRTINSFEIQAAWTFAGPGGQYFEGPWHGRSAVTLSLRRSF